MDPASRWHELDLAQRPQGLSELNGWSSLEAIYRKGMNGTSTIVEAYWFMEGKPQPPKCHRLLYARSTSRRTLMQSSVGLP